jgi:hypothetical protein
MHLLHELFLIDEHPRAREDVVHSGGASPRAFSDVFVSHFAILP